MTDSTMPSLARYQPALHRVPVSDPNRLGIDYRAEAARLPYRGEIWDCHVHLRNLASARAYMQAAELYGTKRVWSMTPLEEVDAVRDAFGDRISFIAVPDYWATDWLAAMGDDWLRRIEAFARKGVKVCKFWAAPRGLDKWDQMWIDSPIRLRSMKLAHELGMTLMVHVADPDTWFATKYADAGKYGTKRDHYARFERMLAKFPEADWWAAHMAGSPEDLGFLQGLLDRWPRLRVDTSATKWMVRELSKHADVLRDFLARNPGRVMFGTDIVADPANLSFDLFASRFWALRTLLETDYDGPSPIVDPDLPMVDPSLPKESTARLRGASVDTAALAEVYVGACRGLLG